MTDKTLEVEYLVDLFQKHDHDKFMAFTREFVHASTKSVKEWLEGKSSPRGEKLIRLRVLLDLLDYRVEAFDELARPVKDLGRLLAFDLITMGDALELLNYGRRQLVFRLILQGTGMFPQRLYPLETYVSRSAVELNEAINQFHQKFSEQFDVAVVRGTVDQAAPKPAVPDTGQAAAQSSVSSILPAEVSGIVEDMSGAIRLVSYIAGAIRRQNDPDHVRSQVFASTGREILEDAIEVLADILDANL